MENFTFLSQPSALIFPAVKKNETKIKTNRQRSYVASGEVGGPFEAGHVTRPVRLAGRTVLVVLVTRWAGRCGRHAPPVPFRLALAQAVVVGTLLLQNYIFFLFFFISINSRCVGFYLMLTRGGSAKWLNIIVIQMCIITSPRLFWQQLLNLYLTRSVQLMWSVFTRWTLSLMYWRCDKV